MKEFKDPKVVELEPSKVTKAELFIEALKFNLSDKKQEEESLKEDITSTYYLFQSLAKEHNLI